MRALPSFVAVLVAVLAACGKAPREETASLPADTLIRPLVREPLAEADLAGFALDELALEIPWTTNQVVREAASGSPPTSILSAEVSGHEGFDRALFAFDDSQPVPGYRIALPPSGDTLPCAERGARLAGERSLVVAFHPARPGAEGAPRPAGELPRTGKARMSRAGMVCASADTLVWMAELARGEQLRILELRGPNRIAVDVR